MPSTGARIWSIFGWASVGGFADWGFPLADGYLAYLNAYDMQVYSIGKGPSATTVVASPKVSTQGSSLLLEGTVIDTAAGTKQDEQAARFPSGVPAVSDASMSGWMEYVYMQKPKPSSVVGVSVHLTAIDPNGNFQDIGITASNSLGNYAIAWTPPVPGLYTVTATFEGSNSYYRSEAGTSFVVSTAPSAAPVVTATPTQTTAPTLIPTQTPTLPSPSIAPQPTSGMPTATYIAIGAAVVIIVAAAAALILRRRK